MPEPVALLLAPFPVWLAVLPIVIPLLLSGLRRLDEDVPRWLLPLLEPLLGVTIVSGTAVLLDLPRRAALALGIGLGLAGVGVREVIDQLWQALLRINGPQPKNGRLKGLPR